jgi:hypothetical protein
MNVIAGYSIAKNNSRLFFGSDHYQFKSVGSNYSDYFGIFKGNFSSKDETYTDAFFSAEILNEGGSDKFVLRKITGDPVVPAGKISSKTSEIPKINGYPVDSKL